MITVAGFNTAIDHLVTLDALVCGGVQRAERVDIRPGGKGVHVAQTVAALDERVQLIGLTDATHRNLIARRMAERGVLFHGIEFDGALRACLALRERDGRVTEILDPGAEIRPAVRQQLLDTCWRCAEDSDLLVLSGSLPRGFPPDTYAQLVQRAAAAGVRCLVDASGEVLRHAAGSAAFLLKPNRDEASDWFGRPVHTPADAAMVARALFEQGVAWPVVTLGVAGAVGFDGREAWHAAVELDAAAHAVGSGDCLLAGLAVGLRREHRLEEALRLGVACGAANAMDEESGYVRRDRVRALQERVRLRRLDG